MSRSVRATLSRRSFVKAASAAAISVSAVSAFATPPVLASPRAPTTAPGVQQSASTLTMADPFEPKTYTDSSGGLYAIREGMAQGLVQIDFNTQFAPALATAWAQTDPTTWRFTLRQGVQFHNGVVMDAGAVAFNLKRLAEANDAAAAFKGASVTAEDSSTITIKTSKPAPYLPAILADGKAVIYEPSASFAADGSMVGSVGTGPYKLTEFRPGDRRVFTAHAGFWGGAPSIGEVQYLFVPQGQTRANMIRTGAADIARVVSPADMLALQSTSGVQVMTTGLPRIRVLYLNTQSRATADVRVRRALAHAVERQIIVDTVLENQGVSQVGLFRPDYPWGNPSLAGLPFDQAAARTLLAEAGYGPSNPLSLTLTTYSSRPELPTLAQVLQEQLAEVGVQIELSVPTDATVMEGLALRGEADIVLVARNALFLFDPQAAFESDYFSTGSYNLSRYDQLDAEITAAGVTPDTTQRYAQYRQMEQRIIEQDVAAISLNSYVQIDAVRSNISGYLPHPADAIAITERIVKA